MQIFSSLKFKIVIYSIAMVVLAVSVSTYLAYQQSKEQLEQSLGQELLAISNSASLFIDVFEHDEIVRIDEELVEGMESFTAIREILESIQKINTLDASKHGSPIYTLRKTIDFESSNLLEFVVMTEKNKEGNYIIGNTIPAEPHHLRALSGESVVTGIYTDAEGDWISASAPIKYSDGSVAALLQTDRSISFYYDQALIVAKSLSIGSILTILVVALLSYFSTSFITKPLKIIATAASRIGRGDYSQKIELDRDDEIGILADTFNRMSKRLTKDKKIKKAQKLKLEKLASCLEKANEVLEEKVNERTHALSKSNKELEGILVELKQSQANLVQSEKMASLGQLAAGVAHEINNPMAFITSNMKTLKDYVQSLLTIGQSVPELSKAVDDKDEQKINDSIKKLAEIYAEEDVEFIAEDSTELLDESIAGADRVKEIVMNLKGFSRVDNEGMQKADINECITSTLKVAHNETKYKCEIETNLAEIPTIMCNPGKLNQVFLNIIVNGAHAIEENGIIRISTETDDKNVFVAIKDNGCGIPQENIDKLFDAFFTTKPVGKGTGLGLYISFGIIEEHHGEIKIESEVGEGTKFIIKLPIEQPEIVENPEEKVAA